MHYTIHIQIGNSHDEMTKEWDDCKRHNAQDRMPFRIRFLSFHTTSLVVLLKSDRHNGRRYWCGGQVKNARMTETLIRSPKVRLMVAIATSSTRGVGRAFLCTLTGAIINPRLPDKQVL